jgi:hypothetical protein
VPSWKSASQRVVEASVVKSVKFVLMYASMFACMYFYCLISKSSDNIFFSIGEFFPSEIFSRFIVDEGKTCSNLKEDLQGGFQ